ncbi:ACP S-malonyltransferase [Aeromonas veronii]|uniref:ACP S-malonyltransferase n=1 Tax=Aeromonas veronii TaxID=654 RepID=UPI0031FD9A59
MTIKMATQPVVLLFSGQGNPVIGMGSNLWDLNATTKKIWDCVSDISGLDLRRLCLRGPMNRLIQTTVQQLAVTAINVTLYKLCQERLGHMQVMGSCGHSVGEYSALYAAGVMSLETLFRTIHFRANTMHEVSLQQKSAMLALKGVDNATLAAMIANAGIELDISCDNTPRQQVVGGSQMALNDFLKVLIDQGHEYAKLGVSGAWHTSLMIGGVQPMRDFLATQTFLTPTHEVLMNVTAQAETEPACIKNNLSLHLTHTVKWADTMVHFLTAPIDSVFLEISNKQYLGHMLNDFLGFTAERSLHCHKILKV